MENLSRDLEKVVSSLKRDVALGGLERLKLEEELQRSRRKCEELEERVTRLIEDKKISENREKRAEERCQKICTENSNMSYEFQNSTSYLNETIEQLKNKNLENERLVGVLQEKYEQEIEDMRQEKLKAVETIEELKNKNLEKYEGASMKVCQEIENLRHENLKAVETIEELKCVYTENKKTIEELRLRSSESDRMASVYKSRLENLSPRIKKIEDNLADMLNIEVGGLANLAMNLRELTTNSKDVLDSKSKKGDGNSNQGWARGEDDDSHNTVKTSRASQLGLSSPEPESNGCENSPGSGAHASVTRLMSGEGCSGKITRSSSIARDIVEIIDSDDDGAGDEMKFVQTPSSKRSQRKDLFSHSTSKRKRN